MKRVLCLATVMAVLALPAHGQSSKTVPVASAASPITSNSGASGGSGGSRGFSGGGSVGGPRLPAYPRTQFGVLAASGTQQDFVPSTFLEYDRALAEGRDILSNPPKTVVEAAHTQAVAPAGKARFTFVQNANGDPVIVVR